MMKIVVTGAAGDLGRKACRHLRSLEDIDVVAIDIDASGEDNIVAADLATYDPDWVRLFEGADAVIHLAANRRRYARWPDLWRDNVDALLNVYEAAAQHGPLRFVFASSLATMDEYFWEPGGLGTESPENPSTSYGATKVFGERIGKYFAAHCGLSVVCLRIGDVLIGERQSLDKYVEDAECIWEQQKWLSVDDFGQILVKSLEAENIDFAVINAVSDNQGMRWDLSAAEQVIGYQPRSSYIPVSPPLMRNMRERLRRWVYRLISRKVRPGP